MERGPGHPLSLTIHLACAIDRTVAESQRSEKFHFFGLALESFLEEGISQPSAWSEDGLIIELGVYVVLVGPGVCQA